MKWQAILPAPAAAMLLAVAPGPAAAQPAATSTAMTATATAPAKQLDARIPFADSNIFDWRAEGDSTVYFQDNQRKWYKATLFSPAFDLPTANAIGIDAGPTGSLDKFGAIMIHGRRYSFSDFVRVAGPPTKGNGAKKHGAPKKGA